jgi:hypothetical protein
MQVNAGFEQVRGERVPEPVNPAGLPNPGASLREAITSVVRQQLAVVNRKPTICGVSRMKLATAWLPTQPTAESGIHWLS